jgi:YfiH family protein
MREASTPGNWLAAEGFAAPVAATMTTRLGGASGGPWAAMNLGDAVGDAADAVAHNRRAFARAIGARPVFLKQVHGAHVARVGVAEARACLQDGAAAIEADASVTTESGVACTVLVADCLPLLFAAPGGRAVGAAHAGWRGLAGGVVEAALQAVCEAAGCDAGDVRCWLGACIGPRRFEVGADVLQAFGADPAGTDALRFAPCRAADGTQRRWLANLPQLARDRLRSAGVHRVAGGTWCTFEDSARFYSFRRDGITGRMAAAVWIGT